MRMASAPSSPRRAPGEVHPVFHEVSAGAFDDAGCDLPAALQRGGVVQERFLVRQVCRAFVGVLTAAGVEVGEGGGSSQGAGGPGSDPGNAGSNAALNSLFFPFLMDGVRSASRFRGDPHPRAGAQNYRTPARRQISSNAPNG